MTSPNAEDEIWSELRSLLASRLSPEESMLVRRGEDFKLLGVDSILLFEILDILEAHFEVAVPNDVAAALTSFDDLVAAVTDLRG